MKIDYEGKRRTACISFLTSCSTEKHAFAGIGTYLIGLFVF